MREQGKQDRPEDKASKEVVPEAPLSLMPGGALGMCCTTQVVPLRRGWAIIRSLELYSTCTD